MMTEAQNKLVTDNINFANWKARRWETTQKHIDIEELVSIAYLSLVKAASTYDESKGTKFATFLNLVIDNDIKKELEKQQKQYIVKQNVLTAAEISVHTEEDLDYSMEHLGEHALDIKEAMDKLPEFCRKVLIDFYELGYNQYEIAAMYNVSQTKVSLALKKAIGIMAEHMES